MATTTKQDKVRELQRTLYRAAKADPGRRFHALYDKVYRRDVLERAWGQVRANHGAAGIDHQTLTDVERYGVSLLLDELAADLKEGRWRPLPARRVLIPKPGREERRPLSIPTVRDRVVQSAVRIVIEPIFEADFLPCSFGFRPKRAAHDALQVLIDQAWQGRRWLVETDVADCFEAIPHSRLLSAVEERIVDRQLLRLLRAMLRAGVMEQGAVARRGRTRQSRHVTFLARWPSGQAMQRARDRIRELTERKRLSQPVEETVQELNRFLRGWGGYFRYGNSAQHFHQISTYALKRLASFVAKRHGHAPGYGMSVVAYRSTNRLGLISLNGTVVAPRPFKPGREQPNAGGEGRR